ncbi:arylsulfatase [Polaribacter aestuariivivens]|uniref:Arylsulfatase n=1 Tax=Polaribacter aestuariivivens TaxID=2304626 RepID=A0A5S3N1G9_9FLAO|nr:arylsulfatase [Polaribacter aestuariivivens]TMM29085.1 arylsulfatase [Polaribacter aestuariivivens]
MKKITHIIFGLSFFLCSAQKENVSSKKGYKKPNIVYILADDLGIGDISGLNANAKVNTPNIDALIKNGMSFTDAHTTSSVCTPSRYSIITGEYSWRTKLKARVLDGYSKALIEDSKDTAPKLLQRNGYQTAMIGKWHLGWNWQFKNEEVLEMTAKNPYQFKEDISKKVDYSKSFSGGPTDNGFDYFFGLNASLDFPPYVYSENNKLITIPTKTMKPDGKSNNFPGGRKNDLVGGQKLKRKGDKAADFKAEQVMLDITNKSVDYITNYSSKNPFFLYIPLTAPHTPVYPREEFLGKSDAGIYGDFIQELDWTVGQIVNALKEKGLEENTIIIFTADNGASKSSFPIEFEEKYHHKPSAHLRGRKATLHQGGHTVPFIVQWKNIIKPNTKNNTTISLGDLYATCAELVNAKTDKNQGVDSYSILSLLKGKDNYERKASVYTNFAGRFSIRKDDWKMDLNPKKGKSYLFNIAEDPSETNNLFYDDSFSKKKKELTLALNQIILNGRSTTGEVLENDGPKIWKELFWMKKKKQK